MKILTNALVTVCAVMTFKSYAMKDIAKVAGSEKNDYEVVLERRERDANQELKKAQEALRRAEQNVEKALSAKALYSTLAPIQQKRIFWLFRLYAGNNGFFGVSNYPDESERKFEADKLAIILDKDKSVLDVPNAPVDPKEWALEVRVNKHVEDILIMRKALSEMATDSSEKNHNAINLLRHLDDAEIMKKANEEIKKRQEAVRYGYGSGHPPY